MKLRKLNTRGFSHHFAMALVVLICAIGGTYYLVASHADSVASRLYLSPANQTVTVGSNMVVTLEMNTNGNQIGRIQSVLTYSPSYFSITSIVPGVASNFTSRPLASGQIQLTENPANPVNGTAVNVATITLHAIANGTTSLSLSAICPNGNYYGSTCSAAYGPSTSIPTINDLASVVGGNYIVNTVSNPPAAPATLSAQVVSSTQINLNWPASAGAVGYNVYRDGNDIGTTSNTYYSDSGLTPGTTYTYYVIAYNAVGNKGQQSPPSNSLRMTTPPAAPGNISGQAISSTQINLNWSASTGATGYAIYRNGAEIATTGSGSSTSPTNYVSSGLSPSTRYSYYVVAYNSNGQRSSPSTTLSVVTQSAPTTTNGAEQLSIPPQRRPAQYLSLCGVGKTGYVSDGTSNCWAGGSLLENYAPSVPGTYYNVPCVSVSSNSTADRFVYIASGEVCPGQTTAVPLQLLTGEQLSFPPARRPASYLTQCSAGNITYVSLNSCVYRLANTAYQFTYIPPVAGTYYSVPCATVTQGGLFRYLYISSSETCPADTFGNLSPPVVRIAHPG